MVHATLIADVMGASVLIVNDIHSIGHGFETNKAVQTIVKIVDR